MVNMGGQIGGAVTASVTPWIAPQFGWTTSFAMAAGFAVLSALLWLTVHPERPLGSATISLSLADTETGGLLSCRLAEAQKA
jgi:cyanate permease